jgi:hypothetical protein
LSHSALTLTLAALAATDPAPAAEAPPRIDLAHLFVTTKEGTRVAPAVLALRGRRVRVVGFMAQMEDAPRGSFYLTRRPVQADESGAGTADLPPQAVRVEVPGLAGEEIAWVPDLVEAVGALEVGRAEDPEGRVSWVRLILDAPASASQAPGHDHFHEAPAPAAGRSHP